MATDHSFRTVLMPMSFVLTDDPLPELALDGPDESYELSDLDTGKHLGHVGIVLPGTMGYPDMWGFQTPFMTRGPQAGFTSLSEATDALIAAALTGGESDCD